jgi:peptidoglycan/xylan/chitin deacetylase (PgdA/CDA1 family)
MIPNTMKAASGGLLRRIPIPLWRRLFPKTTIGICYHMVSDTALPHLKHYSFLNAAGFEADLDYVQRNFDVVPYAELERRSAARHCARRNEVIITFDDGFAECASVAAPILRRRGMNSVFFVITDLIDNTALFRESEASLCIEALRPMPVENVLNLVDELGLGEHVRAASGRAAITGLDGRTDIRLRPLLHWLLTITPAEADLMHRLASQIGVESDDYLCRAKPYLTTQQIRQLHADGFTIGAHGRNHRWLQDLPQDEAEREIVESCRIVRDITGQASVPFAFPYFGGGLDRAWLAGIRARHDFIGLFFDTDGLREDAPFVVQRVFGERFGTERTLDTILRRAWARPATWRRRFEAASKMRF